MSHCLRASRATVSDIGSLRSWRSMTKTCVSQGEARHPDAFILGLLTASPRWLAMRGLRHGLNKPAMTPAALIAAMPLVLYARCRKIPFNESCALDLPV